MVRAELAKTSDKLALLSHASIFSVDTFITRMPVSAVPKTHAIARDGLGTKSLQRPDEVLPLCSGGAALSKINRRRLCYCCRRIGLFNMHERALFAQTSGSAPYQTDFVYGQ